MQGFIDDFSTKHDVERQYLYGVFSRLKSKKDIHQAWEVGGGKITWPAYRDLFVNMKRIARGKAFLDQHIDTMIRAEQVFGVPREYIAAIIGVETNWGETMGDLKILGSWLTHFIHLVRAASTFFSM